MKKVILYKLNSEANQEKLAEFQLNDSNLVVVNNKDAPKPVVKGILEKGINNYHGEPEHLFPTDGIKFLEELQYNFKSGYLLATDVLEG